MYIQRNRAHCIYYQRTFSVALIRLVWRKLFCAAALPRLLRRGISAAAMTDPVKVWVGCLPRRLSRQAFHDAVVAAGCTGLLEQSVFDPTQAQDEAARRAGDQLPDAHGFLVFGSTEQRDAAVLLLHGSRLFGTPLKAWAANVPKGGGYDRNCGKFATVALSV